MLSGITTFIALTLMSHSEASTAERLTQQHDQLTTTLIQRALRAETDDVAHTNWENGTNIALSVRARVELLRGSVSSHVVQKITRRAYEAAQQVLQYEAAALREQGNKNLDPNVRGWGTSKTIGLGTVKFKNVIDAYSTGTALGCLADLAELLSERGDDQTKELYNRLTPIIDYWIQSRMFSAPGGPSFDKIADRDPEIRKHVVHNTDALFGRALLLLSRVATHIQDNTNAQRYRSLAQSIAQQIKLNVIDHVLQSNKISLDAWTYELTLKDKIFKPRREEDSNHASYLLDFLDTAAATKLDSWLSERLVADLGKAFSTLVVSHPEGTPAIELYIDPASIQTEEGGKERCSDYVFKRDTRHTRRLVSLKRSFAANKTSLDMGLSLRTSWGWVKALRTHPELLMTLGDYLIAAAHDELPRNLFVAQAVFWRLTEPPSRSQDN